MNKDFRKKMSHAGFDEEHCKLIEPLIADIDRLKKEKNAVILAHTYQTPDIIYGVADFVGDSYGLSMEATKTDADVIVFCGVRFMAETAKILNPGKTVLMPAPLAGCSLADSVSATDVRELKRKNPRIPVVTYVNTTAEVKAESDICCTSANAEKILKAIPDRKVIFIPDRLMAANLEKLTGKELVKWEGTCIVHENFDSKKLEFFKKQYPGLKVLAHSECAPNVAALADLVGGTGDMVNYVKATDEKFYMLVTECGLNDRMKAEFPDKNFIGMCGLCPFMKMNNLQLIRQVLLEPNEKQIIEIPEETRARAEISLRKMIELSNASS